VPGKHYDRNLHDLQRVWRGLSKRKRAATASGSAEGKKDVKVPSIKRKRLQGFIVWGWGGWVGVWVLFFLFCGAGCFGFCFLLGCGESLCLGGGLVQCGALGYGGGLFMFPWLKGQAGVFLGALFLRATYSPLHHVTPGKGKPRDSLEAWRRGTPVQLR